ncbi:hypothetical protein FIBSPDRAFT_812686 [Athelia psychrophila]|uniref:DNA mismatch repair proteins mutS family domain-containing protein n=1 Tax=Athelia psychrophila TaxID=1759441 RepID=A0A166V5G2_9AGAM|nr:hypothetical protein FIBSPDRAFT_812686 [Fibularhizoctonia sp. CBS 109695]
MLGGVIMENLAKFPHCILLTRVGQFYESYFDQAIEVARLLNIKLTSRAYNGGRIPMCGFPFTHLDKHLKVLVQQNQRFVAMCEEFPRYVPGIPKPEFDRRVVRVITPGTLIDEPFLNQYENNYLLAVSCAATTDSTEGQLPVDIGLAWIDVSTGEFFVKQSTLEGLRDELARIGPKEIVLDEALRLDLRHPIRTALAEESSFFSFIPPSGAATPNNSEVSSTDDLTTPAEESLSLLTTSFLPSEAAAVNILSSFLHANLLEHMPTLTSPNREGTGDRMQIDAHTIRALEIKAGAAEGTTKGSLLSVIKRTLTSSGTRLLARWLCSPSTSIKEITARQSLVEFLHVRPNLGEDISQILGDMEDASRIVQKFLLRRGDVSDLSDLHAAIAAWTSVQRRIGLERKMELQERGAIREDQWASVTALMSRLNNMHELAKRICLAIELAPVANKALDAPELPEEDVEADTTLPPSTKSDKHSFTMDWAIKPSFSQQLGDLHARYDSLLLAKEKLEREFKSLRNVPTLTLRCSPAFGMHVHTLRKKNHGKLDGVDGFVRISESASTSTFFHQRWSQLGGQIVETAQNITAVEKETFEILRTEINALSTEIRRNARIMDELDVTLGFAKLAAEMGFVRPVLNDENMYEVVNGRHPTVELGLLNSGRVFTPNSATLAPDSRLHIITGPNMAGKSTFLRQIALVTILAQTGSFVPADHAVLGMVDKLFSRVGAKDDLFRDRSTFMVEMLETAEILRRATPKSLVIMDEVGRGTTVKDGLAIAFATVHHLVSVNRCRALFATHFHELADLLGYSDNGKGLGAFSDVAFFCTDVDETEDGHFAYSHRMRPGVNRDSHGLKVAQLAGMPASAMAMAHRALSMLHSAPPVEAQKTLDLISLGQKLTAVDQ